MYRFKTHTMSNNTEDDETTGRQKRDSVETDQEPVSSSESSDPKPEAVEGRIPKKQKKLPEDDPVIVARKALEMFKEITAEDGDTIEESKENLESKAETKSTTLGSPRGPKIHYRLPIISQQEEFLL